MSVEIALGTPLADALNTAIQGKIAELGWAGPGSEVSAMSEYFVLMLANGKTEAEIVQEIQGDLLGLGPEDETAPKFARWLSEQVAALSSQSGNGASAAPSGDAMDGIRDESMTGPSDVNMDTSTDMPATGLNAPTGPKAMRNGNNMMRGSREKRLMGQISRAMDRSQDSVLHRVRTQSGNERISRGPPAGPRLGVGRQPRTTNTRMASIAAGMANMSGMPHPGGPMPMNPMNGMPPMPPNGTPYVPPELYAMMEQQNLMLQQMQQQLQMQQASMRGGFGGRGGRGGGFRRGGGHFQQQHNGSHAHPQQQQSQQAGSEGTQSEGASQGDAEMAGAKPNPEETVCRFNLRCQNKDCKFAHQSPAAPPGITIDVKDVCSYGVACKNRKCVGRHPSPAAKAAHQSEQDCKYWPNCANPLCAFRHPTMPPCRNGGECKVPGCKFTHLKTPCKFRPCTNRSCPFLHEEGQRGTFQDKVWTADGAKEHVSERKFANDTGNEELVLPGSGQQEENQTETEVIM